MYANIIETNLNYLAEEFGLKQRFIEQGELKGKLEGKIEDAKELKKTWCKY